MTSAARVATSRWVWQCQTLSPNFRQAAKLTQHPIPELKPSEILVKNKFLGINASDINWTAGRYDPTLKPPFDLGFEGIGEVVSLGTEAPPYLKPGHHVAYMHYGSFSDYVSFDGRTAFPIPAPDPGYLPLLVSGLTASIALQEVGDIPGDKKSSVPSVVLVTAAAGGTGQFAVQLAKRSGCHVIGTTSNDDKAAFLRQIGCDRVVNYKTEDLSAVLRKECPKGVDCVYESVGGNMFDICLNSLAEKGRLVVIGFITGYQDEGVGFKPNKGLAVLPAKLLKKSASVRGFFLFHYLDDFREHFAKLSSLLASGELVSKVEGGFRGLESVPDAVEYLYSGKNVGKVIVELS